MLLMILFLIIHLFLIRIQDLHNAIFAFIAMKSFKKIINKT